MKNVEHTPPTKWCRSLETKLDPEAEFAFLHVNEDRNDVAVLLREQSRVWLVAEQSYYEPMDMDQAVAQSVVSGWSPFEDDWQAEYEYPFETYGTQWVVDLHSAEVATRQFNAYEGDIQGFVYASLAVVFGGALEPDSYYKYMQAELRTAIEDNDSGDFSPFRPLLFADIDNIQTCL